MESNSPGLQQEKEEWPCLGQSVLRANATKGGLELFIVISNE